MTVEMSYGGLQNHVNRLQALYVEAVNEAQEAEKAYRVNPHGEDNAYGRLAKAIAQLKETEANYLAANQTLFNYAKTGNPPSVVYAPDPVAQVPITSSLLDPYVASSAHSVKSVVDTASTSGASKISPLMLAGGAILLYFLLRRRG